MKLKTGVMPTLAVVASKLGGRGYQGNINKIVTTGIARKDAPIFSGKRGYQGRIDAIVIQESIARRWLPSWAG